MKRLVFLMLALGLVAGCKTVGPEFKQPELMAASNYADAHTDSGAAQFGEGPALRWWEIFGSPELNTLIDRAMVGNHSLAAANATLERTRERINAVAGRRQPQADASAKMQYEQVNLSAFGLDLSGSGLPGIGNPHFDLYSVGGGVSFDLDLFGGNRRALEQTVAEAAAQRYQAEAAHLTIAGRVVTQALTIAALNDRIATEHELLAEDQRNIDLTQKRQRAGVGTLVEVLSAQGQMAGDQGNLPQIEQQRTEARNMLAILLGISPAELGATAYSLKQFTLPKEVPVAMPSALVHKRPDILQAEAQFHAATASIGVAAAKLYPDITLGATLSQSTSSLEDIFSSGTRGFDIFASLTAPMFHGGTLSAEKREAEAAARASAATYRQTVLTAFGQVSDLLAALGNDTQGEANQQQAVSITERSLHLSRRSFEVGNSGILQVLDASRVHQRSKLALVTARTQHFLDVARLYVATAGGWTGPAVVVAK